MKFWSFRSATAAFALVIVLAGAAAYANSFRGPFVFDDRLSIPENPTIRELWPILRTLHPPGEGRTVDSRPVLNLSLALSYALSGDRVWGYHVMNLLIHLLAALTLFGLVRRTGRRWVVADACGEASAAWLALAITLIWELHPLQTESVTYMVQRAESLMGLFYLCTLYGFIRAEGDAGWRASMWRVGSWLACLAGMGTKEVMVSAPLMVLAYDACFIAGSWRQAWRQRTGYYTALAATWIPLAVLVVHSHSRGGSAGANEEVTALQYWLTQPGAILRYLRLAFWPAGQVFNYGAVWVGSVRSIALPTLAVVGLIGATARGLAIPPHRGWAVAGFLGLWFFAILAPTSLIPGALQTVAEHRMYLALIPVIAGATLGLVAVGRRFRCWGPRAVAALGFALALGCAWATHQRNADYATELALYAHDAAVQPGNPSAHAGLGMAEIERGQLADAATEFERAIRLKPGWAMPEYDLGLVLERQQRLAEAERHLRAAIDDDPDYIDFRTALFRLMGWQGRVREAQRELVPWIRTAPVRAPLLDAQAKEWESGPNPAEGIALAETLVQALPDYSVFQNDLGVALERVGRTAEALLHYREAVRLEPGNAEAHYNLARNRMAEHRVEEAVGEYRAALASNPNLAYAHCNLADALLLLGLTAEAIQHYQAAVRLNPRLAYPREALIRLHAAPPP
jgi:tetratricopeptide (TPR) repeat protein